MLKEEKLTEASVDMWSFGKGVQCDGSKDKLDWRIDFKYPNLIC